MSYKDYRMSADTSEESEAVYFKLLSKKAPFEKLQMVSQMNAAVRSLTMNGLRERHPGESELQLKVRLAELLYGQEIAERITPHLESMSDQ